MALKSTKSEKDTYLAINPKGKMPALRFDDSDVGRREAEALSYTTSEVHAAYGGYFGPQNFAETPTTQAEVKRKTYETSPDITNGRTAF